MLRNVLFAALPTAALFACSERAAVAPAAAPVADTAMTGMTPDTHGVVITNAQSRPTPPLATVGVAYLSITNHGMTTDHLLSASSPVAARVELHVTIMEGNDTRMRPVENLELAPHLSAVLEPGGMHLMLMDLAAPLVVGEHFPLTLKFETAGEITVDVVVQADAETHRDAHPREQD